MWDVFLLFLVDEVVNHQWVGFVIGNSRRCKSLTSSMKLETRFSFKRPSKKQRRPRLLQWWSSVHWQRGQGNGVCNQQNQSPQESNQPNRGHVMLVEVPKFLIHRIGGWGTWPARHWLHGSRIFESDADAGVGGKYNGKVRERHDKSATSN